MYLVSQCDRLAVDMAVELRRSGVASVSLWPGAVPTELVTQMLNTEKADAVSPKVRATLP